MGSLHEVNRSLWVATSDPGEGQSGELPSSRFDVAVVGAGIAGLTTARLLAGDGARVVVLEAGDLAAGATGYTTAQGDRASTHRAQRRHRPARARASPPLRRGQRRGAGEDRRTSRGGRHRLRFHPAPACTYTEDPARAADVESEYEAGMSAGLPVRLSADTELPFPVAAAVWLDDQAHFHPRKYCVALAGAVTAAGGKITTRGTGTRLWSSGPGTASRSPTSAIAGRPRTTRRSTVCPTSASSRRAITAPGWPPGSASGG